MANKIKKEEVLDEHHQAEKDKILEEHHKKERKNIKITLGFIFVCAIVAIGFLSYSGILDENSNKVMDRADTICFLSGHPGGLNEDSVERNGTAYSFQCSTENITMKYNPEENKGFIEWNK